MVRATQHTYTTEYLHDGSPVLVMHAHQKNNVRKITQPTELPPAQEPLVVIYPQPTLAQSWQVIQKGMAMFAVCTRSIACRYLRRCNMAHEHLAGIRVNDKQ